jgi:transcription-repair coupling factor (superfamily II helicase)
MNLENKKLIQEKKLYHNQVDIYISQINNLSAIIKNKDNLINALKVKEMEDIENENITLNKSKSCTAMKFESTDFNGNIIKLINDNKENKMRIELLNDKLKSINKIETKFNELLIKNH